MKRIIYLLLSLLVISSFAGCSSSDDQPNAKTDPPVTTSAQKTEPEFDLDAFKAAISQCQSEINETSVHIANMGKYEFNYWNTLGSLSDNMTDKAFEWLAKNSDATKESVESAYESIRKQYKEITLTEYSGKEAEEIYAAFDSLFQAYDGMYNLVTKPSGSLNDFVAEYNSYIDAIQKSDNDLSLFLG